MLGLLSLPKLTSSSGDEWMTSSRVGHSLTDGGHVLQDMKEANEGGVSNAHSRVEVYGSMSAFIVAPARARVFEDRTH